MHGAGGPVKVRGPSRALALWSWRRRLCIAGVMTKSLTLRRPDDWHLHLRDGAMLRAVLPESARHFARAIIMPNLVPPVVTSRDARAYRDRILAALPEGMAFTPLMTLYLTEETDPRDVAACPCQGLISAVKLYPAGATTNSASGVQRFRPGARGPRHHGRDRPAALRAWRGDRSACRHFRPRGSVHRPRARPSAPRHTRAARGDGACHHPRRGGLRHVPAPRSGATITTHHLVINRNHILVGGIKPHYYCLPVAKREEHRLALRAAATSGDPRFFLGTDSAPHADPAKESACGCAGCFTATNTLSILAHVFEDEARARSNSKGSPRGTAPPSTGLRPTTRP